MAFLDFLFGGGERQVPTLNPQQLGFLQKLLGGLDPSSFDVRGSAPYRAGESYLSDLLSPSSESLQRFQAPYLKQFKEDILPQIAAQYGGGVGPGGSSAFQNALAQAATGLQTNLAGLREQLRSGAAGQALGYATAPAEATLGGGRLGLGTSPFGYVQQPQGFLPFLGQGLGGGVGSSLGYGLARLF